jgi:hypothetical protein
MKAEPTKFYNGMGEMEEEMVGFSRNPVEVLSMDIFLN